LSKTARLTAGGNDVVDVVDSEHDAAYAYDASG
jgi:hypothetical protein